MKISKMEVANQQVFAEREGLNKAGRADKRFSSEYIKSSEHLSRERLNELLTKIDEQGKQLGLVPTYGELKAYREKVKDFLTEAVSRMYLLNTEGGWDYMGRRKVFTTIKKIDEHLVGLTEDVRQGQNRQLSIMDKIDAIRGLLVDLYT